MAKAAALLYLPYQCCAICGPQLLLEVIHLDQDATNNARENLARMCPSHHDAYDAGLYPVEGVRILQDHFQANGERLDFMRARKTVASGKRNRELVSPKTREELEASIERERDRRRALDRAR